MTEQRSVLFSVLVAAGICIANVLIGLLVARLTFNRPFSQFIAIVLGSMAARIMIVGAFSYYAFSSLMIEVTSYAITLAIGIFVLLFAEIFFFHQTAESDHSKLR